MKIILLIAAYLALILAVIFIIGTPFKIKRKHDAWIYVLGFVPIAGYVLLAGHALNWW